MNERAPDGDRDRDRRIRVERDGAVATIVLDRPDRLNAIDQAMLEQLSAELRALDADPAVRAIVLTGAGRAFCAGLDLADASSDEGLAKGGFPLAETLDTSTFPPCVLHAIDVPTICALNGGAAGFGMDLALACDLRLAGQRAKLAAAFTRRGVLPESGGTWWLPRLVGWQRAAEIFLTARTLSAAECLELGLVLAVVPDADLAAEARALADRIAAGAPLAVRATKRMLRAGQEQGFEEHVQAVYRETLPLLSTDDFAEGMRAFLDKREPRFEGR